MVNISDIKKSLEKIRKVDNLLAAQEVVEQQEKEMREEIAKKVPVRD